MRSKLIVLILIVALCGGCTAINQTTAGATPPSTTPTVTTMPSSTPAPTQTITLSPTPTEEPKRDVIVRNCDEDLWWLEIYYDTGIYEEVTMVGVEYENGVITFYLGRVNGDWELICWVYG